MKHKAEGILGDAVQVTLWGDLTSSETKKMWFIQQLWRCVCELSAKANTERHWFF